MVIKATFGALAWLYLSVQLVNSPMPYQIKRMVGSTIFQLCKPLLNSHRLMLLVNIHLSSALLYHLAYKKTRRLGYRHNGYWNILSSKSMMICILILHHTSPMLDLPSLPCRYQVHRNQ
uniref:Uncharacterized protein n=1 Tax=Opuntia streptacantha TaxID=393608 RepID=A0A7C9DZI7_OPUST